MKKPSAWRRGFCRLLRAFTSPFLEAVMKLSQAGLLTHGSFYLLRLPVGLRARQWLIAAFVSVHSGGTATVSHRLPYYAHAGACKNSLIVPAL